MSWLAEIVGQAAWNLWAHKLRAGLTMFGIAWGLAAIIFTISIGDGFKQGYHATLANLGTDIVIVWGGRTTGQAGDQRAGREVRLSFEDVEAIEEECALVRHVTPELSRNLRASSSYNSGVFSTHGVSPVYQRIRSIRLAQGRLFTAVDMDEARAVCLIGDEVRQQLFAGRPAAGQTIRVAGIPFLVVGELRKKDQSNSYNGLDDNKVIMPCTTMVKYFPDGGAFLRGRVLSNLIFTPVSAEHHQEAVRQVREVLGRRHEFEPGDEGALYVWDTVETARMVNRVYDSMQVFLGFVAVVTLVLGGVGVMNIMLVSVAERTREIGIKQALGATPARILAEFFLESIVLTLMSGAVGAVAAWAITAVVNRLPLPAMFAGLPVRPGTALFAFLALTAVGVLSAIYPARRASQLTPVDALRYE